MQKSASVPAVGRVAAVLSVLSEADHPLTFAELSRGVALPRSSLHNLCSALAEVELVERLADGRFQIGWKVVDLARSRLKAMSLVRAFYEVVDNEQGLPETMVLSVLRGTDVVYVAVVLGSQRVAVRYDVGMHLPAAFTASGKAILSTLPETTVRDLIGPAARSELAAAGTKSVETLLEQLNRARLDGYALDDEETAVGMQCVGFPIRSNHNGEAVGAVAISSIKDGRDFAEAIERVRDIARRITARLP